MKNDNSLAGFDAEESQLRTKTFEKNSTPKSDRQLVDRCLAGDVQAWEQLYLQCHPVLMASIRLLLGLKISDINLVEELAARVWFSLTTNDAERLARFNQDRGCRITTYLALLARDEAKRYFRSERRRKEREKHSSRFTANPQYAHAPATLSDSMLNDFCDTLTPRESQYYKECLLAPGDQKSKNDFTSANSWQLRHRIHQKLLGFLEKEV